MADNKPDKPKVSTRGYQTFNTASPINVTTFQWDFQGDMLKLIWTPELPKGEQTEKRRYDYNNSWITCIGRSKCNDLLIDYEDNYEIKDEKPWSISVSVATVNQFGIGMRITEDGKKEYYAMLVRNINPETLTSELYIEHVFAAGEIITNYNHNTGDFERSTPVDSEFRLFINDMRCFIQASSKAWNHANRVVDKTYKDMISGDIRAIGKKVGAELVSWDSAERNGVSYGQPSLYDNNSKAANTETITSLDELPFE